MHSCCCRGLPFPPSLFFIYHLSHFGTFPSLHLHFILYTPVHFTPHRLPTIISVNFLARLPYYAAFLTVKHSLSQCKLTIPPCMTFSCCQYSVEEFCQVPTILCMCCGRNPLPPFPSHCGGTSAPVSVGRGLPYLQVTGEQGLGQDRGLSCRAIHGHSLGRLFACACVLFSATGKDIPSYRPLPVSLPKCLYPFQGVEEKEEGRAGGRRSTATLPFQA